MKSIVLSFLMGLMLLTINHNIFAQINNPTAFVWVNPTTNTDGSALTNIGAIAIRCGTSSGNYNLVNTNIATATTLPVSAIVGTDGQYFCIFLTLSGGTESVPSGEVTFTITGNPPPIVRTPNPPTGARAQ